MKRATAAEPFYGPVALSFDGFQSDGRHRLCYPDWVSGSSESGDRSEPRALTHTSGHELAEQPEEPPIVARMVVEIRSDGTRTIARGALEDAASGERVAIEARGSTPLSLAASLARSMLSAPLLARHAVRAMLEARHKKG